MMGVVRMPKQRTHMKNIERYFSESADKWLTRYTNDEERTQAGHIVLAERKDCAVYFLCRHLQTGSRVLDVGCGSGIVSFDIIQKGYYVHAVDVSHRMIAVLKEFFQKNNIPESFYSIQIGDIMDIDFDNESYGGIIALGFLEYQEDELNVLNHLNKCLKKGGVLILSGPARYKITNYFGLDILAEKFGRQAFKLRLRRILQGGNDRIQKKTTATTSISINRYTISRFRQLLQGSGFLLTDYTQHGYAGFYLLSKLLSQNMQMKLHNLFSKLSQYVPISRFANDIVVVATKK